MFIIIGSAILIPIRGIFINPIVVIFKRPIAECLVIFALNGYSKNLIYRADRCKFLNQVVSSSHPKLGILIFLDEYIRERKRISLEKFTNPVLQIALGLVNIFFSLTFLLGYHVIVFPIWLIVIEVKLFFTLLVHVYQKCLRDNSRDTLWNRYKEFYKDSLGSSKFWEQLYGGQILHLLRGIIMIVANPINIFFRWLPLVVGRYEEQKTMCAETKFNNFFDIDLDLLARKKGGWYKDLYNYLNSSKQQQKIIFDRKKEGIIIAANLGSLNSEIYNKIFSKTKEAERPKKLNFLKTIKKLKLWFQKKRIKSKVNETKQVDQPAKESQRSFSELPTDIVCYDILPFIVGADKEEQQQTLSFAKNLVGVFFPPQRNACLEIVAKCYRKPYQRRGL